MEKLIKHSKNALNPVCHSELSLKRKLTFGLFFTIHCIVLKDFTLYNTFLLASPINHLKGIHIVHF